MDETIRVVCPVCSAKIRAPGRLKGKSAKCPQCGETVKIAVLEAGPEPAVPAHLPEEPRISSAATRQSAPPNNRYLGRINVIPDEDEENHDEDTRPSKRVSRKRKRFLLVAGVMGLLLLGGIVAALFLSGVVSRRPSYEEALATNKSAFFLAIPSKFKVEKFEWRGFGESSEKIVINITEGDDDYTVSYQKPLKGGHECFVNLSASYMGKWSSGTLSYPSDGGSPKWSDFGGDPIPEVVKTLLEKNADEFVRACRGMPYKPL